MVGLPPFHYAFSVDDLGKARQFYGVVLGCREGRSAEDWVDFDLFGHQIVAHLQPQTAPSRSASRVDGHDVPIPHFGVVLDMDRWRALAARLEGAGVEFVIRPHIRFEGEVGEQATLFVRDPAGNALEIKAFHDLAGLFAR